MESSSPTLETGSPVLLPKQTTTKKKKSQHHDQHVQSWPRKKGVTLEASYTEPPATDGSSSAGRALPSATDSCCGGGGGLVVAGRTRSLTDDDLEELKGCLDLGFGFSYDEIPELCSTLPALELCYSMSQRYFLEEQQNLPPPPPSTTADPSSSSAAAPPVANWKFSSPGDDPEEVKARLKYWAQAVACTVRLCR